MRWSQSLIIISSASYLGAIVLVLVGYPPVMGLSDRFQLLYYLFGFLTCFITLKYKQTGYFFAFLIGFFAFLSFSGVQVWINYDGDLSLGPFMALWDIALGLALLDNLELPSFFK